jgi:hypothetical protein
MRNTPAGNYNSVLEIKRTGCGNVQATIELGEKTEIQRPSHNLMVNSTRAQFTE